MSDISADLPLSFYDVMCEPAKAAAEIWINTTGSSFTEADKDVLSYHFLIGVESYINGDDVIHPVPEAFYTGREWARNCISSWNMQPFMKKLFRQIKTEHADAIARQIASVRYASVKWICEECGTATSGPVCSACGAKRPNIGE